jgi:hypothetical protein
MGRVDVGAQVDVKVRVEGTWVEVGGTGVEVSGTNVFVGATKVPEGIAVKVWATIVSIRSCGGIAEGSIFAGRQADRARRQIARINTSCFIERPLRK